MDAKRPPLTLNETKAQKLSTNIVVPLPGGSNPFWEGDWVDIPCGKSELLRTFSHRVLDFYGTKDGATASKKHTLLTLKFIDRKRKRLLLDQETHLASLRAKSPHINIQIVDFASMKLSEQIAVAHTTDILVGVHGAGLTHGMFLPPNSTIVEILPPKLMHKGFDNMSKFLDHRHFSRHGSEHDSPGKNEDWQHDDIYIAENHFVELMDEAIVSSLR